MILAGLVHLRGLSLTNLDLSRCKGLSDAALSALQSLSQLKTLHLDWCPWLSDAGLAAISGLPIATLSLAGARDVTPEGLNLLQEIPLTDLSIRNCIRLEMDGGLEGLRGLPLTRLTLECSFYASCDTQTEDYLDPLDGISSLTILRMKYCRWVVLCPRKLP